MRGSNGKGRGVKKSDSPNGRRSSPKGVYIMDKALVPRLKQYLSQFRKGYVPDVEEMTTHLQSRYSSDYSRKKRNSFRLSVQKAYQSISGKNKEDEHLQMLEEKFLQGKKDAEFIPLEKEPNDNYPLSEEKRRIDEDTSDSEVSLTDEPLIELQGSNLMNQSMQSMYKLSTSQPTSEAEDNDQSNNDVDKDNNLNQDDLLSRAADIPTASTPLHTPLKQASELQPKDPETTGNTSDIPETQNKRKLNEDKSDQPNTPRQSKKRRKRQDNNKNEDEEAPKFQFVSTQSTFKFSDIGGCEETIEQVCKMLIHMRHPEVFSTLGITPPRGFLLHGPPGCGKTLLAHAIAGELELPFLKIAATEIVSGVSGESEEKVRELFNNAVTQAPCVVFIDEIDAITPKREMASKDMERRIVSQLLTCMDDLNNNPSAQVLIIGATNRPDSLEPALRRAGRFDREISMGIPDAKARQRILQVLCKQLKLSDDFSYTVLAHLSPGFVGADLMALTREAAMVAVNRVFKTLEKDVKQKLEEETAVNMEDKPNDETQQKILPSTIPEPFHVMEWLKNQPPLTEEQLAMLSITLDDFKAALSTVQPSAKREGFATIPDVTWDDVGALKDVREELTMAILAPVRHPEEFAALGLSHPPGILLAGPPGCGKTLLAKAIANESGINFISVKGPELLNMYVGESERAVRQVFQRARNSSPCVIFFDELDALCPRRAGGSESGVNVRVVNQLLTEMDGLEARKQVYIMAATNRPDIIDPAVMRPGRLDKILYVGLPSEGDRKDILATITKNGTKPVLLPDVDLEKIASSDKCAGFSGADLSALVREASMAALRECIDITTPQDAGLTITTDLPSIGVGDRHFGVAFQRVKPSVSNKDHSMYEKIKTFACKI